MDGTVLVVGLGQACVDFLGTLPRFPEEDGKAELAALHTRCGGPASTAMVTLARLKVQAAFLGSVSDDPFGLQILDNLKAARVDITGVKVTPGGTSQFAFIAITEGHGRRTVFWHRGSAPHLAPADVDLDRFPGARVLHLDGLMIDASREAASQARRRGMTVVMDAGTMRPGSRELVRQVDVLIASQTFALPLVGAAASPETAVSALHALGPGQVVVTLGDKGSLGWQANQFFRQPAFEVAAVDTTGAGDVYHGAYIYGLLQGWDMPGCMRFASAAAALKCRAFGAQGGIPDLAAVNRFLAEQPR